MPTTTGLVLLTAGALGLTTIVVDVVAVSLRRPAASGLALLALYAVPVAVVLGGVPWVLFAIAACGYLLLLLVEGRDRLAHWGRPVGATPRSTGPVGGRILAPPDEAPAPLTGQRIGAVAIALAVILPLMVPGMTGNTLNKLGQTGAGDGHRQRQRPAERVRGAARPVAAGPAGDAHDGEHEPAAAAIPADEGARPLPGQQRLVGQQRVGPHLGGRRRAVAAAGRREPGHRLDQQSTPSRCSSPATTTTTTCRSTTRRARSTTSATTGGTTAASRWSSRTAASGDFSYTVTGNEPTPTVEELQNSPPLSDDQRDQLPTRLTVQPSNLPKPVIDTAKSITAGITSPYLQAKAINDYFTDGTQHFSYSEVTIDGNSGNKLVDFLRNKQGFCEQYAAAMAVMLRVVNIPSRVVLGYTPGVQGDDGRWVVTNHDAHAWVEAYFAGVGWTYFDPTPLSDGRTVAPAYAPRAQASTGPSSGLSASANPSAGPTANQIPQEDLNPGSSGSGLQGSGLITPRRLLVTGDRDRGAAAPAGAGVRAGVGPTAPAADRGRRRRGGRGPGGLGRSGRHGRGLRGAGAGQRDAARAGPKARARAGSRRRRRPRDCDWSRWPRSGRGTRRTPGWTATCRTRYGRCGTVCAVRRTGGGAGGPRCCRRRRCARPGPGRPPAPSRRPARSTASASPSAAP